MSQNLAWEPAEPKTRVVLPKAVKFILQAEFHALDELVIGRANLPYLAGLRAGAIFANSTNNDLLQGLLDVIHAIEEHGDIRLKLVD